MRAIFGRSWCGVILLACCPCAAVGQEAMQDADSLDAELLEGLEAPAPPVAPLDGEDLGASEDPLVRVAGQMREVETSLRSERLGPPTQRLQQEIIADLDKLIAQQQKQCQGGAPKPGASQSPKPGTPKPGDPKPGPPKPGPTSQQVGKQAASDSQDETRAGEDGTAEFVAPQDLLKRVWGHLPARLRERMLQNPNEKFLPKYEREIEEYYRRLIDLEDESLPMEPRRR
jgi:hypothetical protein